MTGKAALGLGPLALLAGCATSVPSPLPAGEAGYAALATPREAAVPTEYVLRAGDTVAVSVYGEPELSSDSVAISNSGEILLPLIGPVRAAGVTAQTLGQDITRAYGAKYLRDPRVTVSIVKAQAQLVTVEGEVKGPGSFPFDEAGTLLRALARAQSPTNVARLDEVAVFRTVDGVQYGGLFDIRAIRAGRAPDLALQPGDLVVVGHSARRAALRSLLGATPLLGILKPL